MSQLVKVTPVTNQQLNELSTKRKAESALNRTKQDIAAEAIGVLHKKEIKG